MVRKRANQQTSSRRTPRVFLSTVIVCMIGAAVVIGSRQFWGPKQVGAQAPPRQAVPRPAGQSPKAQQKITTMAVVNGEQITRQKLGQECLRRYGKEVLETMVNKHLILGACQQHRIQVTPKEIDDEIANVAKKFGLSIDRYLQLLAEERNIAPKQYATDIIWPTIALRKLAAGRIKVSDEEVEKMLQSELGERVQLRMISCSTPKKADEVRTQALANPELFPKLARDHSEDNNTASIGGLVLPIRRNVGEPAVERVAFSLKEGQVSEVVKVANQYLVFKCERRIPAAKITESQAREARNRIREHLAERQLREVSSGLFKELQQHAQVHNVYNNPQLSQQMPGVVATINGTRIVERDLAEECIVRHGLEVLEGEINRLLLAQAVRLSQLTITRADEDREIARAADAYGFTHRQDGSPNVQAWLKHVMEQDGATEPLYRIDAVWPSVALKKLVGKSIQVTEDDLKKGFDANYGPRVEVLAIVLSNHRQANEVWNMANGNKTEKFFGQLAHEYSIEPVSKANFGRVPPIQKWGGRETVEKAAFALQPGNISGLIAVGEKWIILYCTGYTDPVVTEYAAVRDELYKDIYEKMLRLAMAKKFDEIREAAQIDNFLAGTSQSGKRAATTARAPNKPPQNRLPINQGGSATTPPRVGSGLRR